ncbi:MAG: HAMP domain-containing histidine kinase [Proteobacteria bacterium]|nr:HAMP domain-containing histidine kinase [Pseudomonadota bacterium]
MSTQDAVTAGANAAPEAVRAALTAWVWLAVTLVLAVISWVNGLQPSLAAAFFAVSAAPALATFVVLPALNTGVGAAVVLSAWLVSVAALVAATGGAASSLTVGFVVVVAQSVALNVWVAEAGVAVVAAYAAASAAAAGHAALGDDFSAWAPMMVVAYLALAAAMLAGAAGGVSRAMVEQRLAEVAHELRTPLTHILGFSEMIERQVFGPLQERYVEYAGLIRVSGAHLLSLSNDMLDLSRIDAGRYPLTLERFDVREVVTEVIGVSAVSAQSKGVALAATLPDDALPVLADRRAIVRILINAVGNAIKFTPEGGRIEVRALARDRALLLETIDNGPGISTAEKARLGQAFERGASGLGVEGAGLGLSLVRALAALHHGRLSFDDAPGGGAIVRVTLPVLATE